MHVNPVFLGSGNKTGRAVVARRESNGVVTNQTGIGPTDMVRRLRPHRAE